MSVLEEDEKTAGDLMHTYMRAELEKRCRGLESTLQMLEEEKSDAETKCMVSALSRVPLFPIPIPLPFSFSLSLSFLSLSLSRTLFPLALPPPPRLVCACAFSWDGSRIFMRARSHVNTGPAAHVRGISRENSRP